MSEAIWLGDEENADNWDLTARYWDIAKYWLVEGNLIMTIINKR